LSFALEEKRQVGAYGYVDSQHADASVSLGRHVDLRQRLSDKAATTSATVFHSGRISATAVAFAHVPAHSQR